MLVYKRHPAPPRVAPPYFVDESLDYLDRHETGKGCEDFGGVMSAFELSSEECSMMKPKEMEMRYTCESGGWPKDSWATSCTRHYTEYNEIGSKAIEYLDRHDVVCPDGSALRDWKIQMEGKGRVVYSCCRVPGGKVQPQCEKKSTPCFGRGSGRERKGESVRC